MLGRQSLFDYAGLEKTEVSHVVDSFEMFQVLQDRAFTGWIEGIEHADEQDNYNLADNLNKWLEWRWNEWVEPTHK